MRSKKEWAEWLARQEYRVFPVIPGQKQPAIKGWQGAATANLLKIESWWSGEFRNHNIGVATGQGLMVLDCDCKNGRSGLADLEMLDMMGLPQSFRVKTPSGGVHVYLRTDRELQSGVGNMKGFPGIDIRAEGAYVVGPGSACGEGAWTV